MPPFVAAMAIALAEYIPKGPPLLPGVRARVRFFFAKQNRYDMCHHAYYFVAHMSYIVRLSMAVCNMQCC